jgi:ABC-type antimicrobial peptide transport system permease subunit
VYGVTAYGVQLRRGEIGVRLALGATRERMIALILVGGLRTALIGVGLGIGVALGLTRLLQSLLYGVGPRDPLTFLAAPATLIIATACACLFPAWKAAHVDPAETMRRE